MFTVILCVLNSLSHTNFLRWTRNFYSCSAHLSLLTSSCCCSQICDSQYTLEGKCQLKKGWVITRRQDTVQQQSDCETHVRVLMLKGREDELAHSCGSDLPLPSHNVSKAISHTASWPSLPTPALHIRFFAYSGLSNIFKFPKWCSS